MQRSTPWAVIFVAVLAAAAIIAFLLFSNRPAEPVATPSASAEPSASSLLNAEMLERRWTVLFVGTDRNQEREERGEGINTDALLVASLSADQADLLLVSLPRDTVDLPLADGTAYAEKINQLYLDQGIEALRGAMEQTFGVTIDAHVILDMDDMAALIDAVDGVDVEPPDALVDPIVNLDIPAGPQELDAATAMGYVRTRVDQDYGRMRRQQEVIASLVQRLTDADRQIDLQALIDGLESLDTGLPLEELPTLLELGRRAGQAAVENLIIEPPLITFEGDRGDGRGYILQADVEAIRAEVLRHIDD